MLSVSPTHKKKDETDPSLVCRHVQTLGMLAAPRMLHYDPVPIKRAEKKKLNSYTLEYTKI